MVIARFSTFLTLHRDVSPAATSEPQPSPPPWLLGRPRLIQQAMSAALYLVQTKYLMHSALVAARRGGSGRAGSFCLSLSLLHTLWVGGERPLSSFKQQVSTMLS